MLSAQYSPHLRAALQALLVTFLWSTSVILVKIGLKDIPALTFAGLRYGLAALCLLPLAARTGGAGRLRTLSRREWQRLIVLGLLFYAMTQGAQFLGLDYLPATTLSLLLSFSPVMVALLGIALLAESINRTQSGGIALYLAGALIYFYPASIPTDQAIGLGIVLVGLTANSLSTVLGRDVNREATLPALLITVVSMSIGAVVLLTAGITIQGLPAFGLQGWLIIGWLAVVNTAFAFTLWNHTQRTLTAVETSVINNTMLIQIAVMAWVLLDERLTGREIIGLILAGAGTLIVQLRRNG